MNNENEMPSISLHGRATQTEIALFIKQLESIVPNDTFRMSVIRSERYDIKSKPVTIVKEAKDE